MIENIWTKWRNEGKQPFLNSRKSSELSQTAGTPQKCVFMDSSQANIVLEDFEHKLGQKSISLRKIKERGLPLISDEFDISISIIDLEYSVNTGFHQKYHRWRLTDEIDSLLCQDPGFYSSSSPCKNFQLIFFLFVLGHGGGPDPTQKPTEK